MCDLNIYAALHTRIKKAFVKEYVTATGRLVSETQTACVLSLYFDLLPKKVRPRVLKTLLDNINDHNGHLTTGFAGTPYLCLALSECGQSETAVDLLLKDDYPSWLYEVDKGATTIWERWNAIFPDGSFFEPSMSSFNHYAYGSIGEWLTRRLAGIDCIDEGYKKIRIAPFVSKRIPKVKASYESMYGEISVEYSVTTYRIEIPANTTAEIVLPDCKKRTVGSGVYEYTVNNKE